MKAGCELLGVVFHLGSIVLVWWFAGWVPVGLFCALNLGASFFYAVAKRIT